MVNLSKNGAHVSVAGGINKAPGRAAAEGCKTFQCFTRPPQGGPAPVLMADLVAGFKMEMARFGMGNFYIHAPYYINLASLEPRVSQSSIRIIREELERGSTLGAKYVMAHVGSHSGQTLEEGIAKVVAGIAQALDGYRGVTQFLIEISAGSGNVIGDTFEEGGEMVRQLKNLNGFGGICFDTGHAFASGYDFRTPEGAEKVLQEFDEKIGLEFLKLTHVNDSKVDLGMKRDRHEHIGKGFIGTAGLALLLTTAAFRRIDWLLETETEGRIEDVKMLKKMRAASFV